MGHVILVGPEARVRSEFADRFRCAEVVDLHVMLPHRRTGVATALMAECAMGAWRIGASCLGLATGLDEGYAPARALYRRLGFREVAGSLCIQGSRLATDAGPPSAWFELTTYWTKDLASSA